MTMMKPDEIYAESFRIIEAEVGAHSLSADQWQIVRRMIHASGDLELAHSTHFYGEAVAAGIDALRRGCPIVTDVTMVAAGLNKQWLARLGVQVVCLIDDPEVRQQAMARGETRSFCAMEKACDRVGEAIYVIGNAPTALLALCAAVRQQRVQPRLIVAMPVGFVSVVESKQQAETLDWPLITVKGRKGGSGLAAAAVNALAELALTESAPREPMAEIGP
jgi:precorrin-8X/cobalt-precorrin-8 methylmutase